MSIPTRVVSSLPPGTSFSRYLVAKSLGIDQGIATAEGWLDTPHVAHALRAEYQGKASVDPMTSASASAASIAQYGIERDFLDVLRGQSPVSQLRDRGMITVPAHTQIPRELDTGSGAAWLAGGSVIPVVSSVFATVTQPMYSFGVAAVFTRELWKVNPLTEGIVRRILVNRTAAFEGRQFLDPSITATTGLRPASITSGATAVTSTGGTAAQITADLASMAQAIGTAGTSLVWILTPTTAATISARLMGAGATTGLPRELLGLPAIVTAAAPARQITLVDTAGILFSEAGLDILATEKASLEMNDVATSPQIASTVLISTWQLNLVAVKVTRWLSWQRAVPGSVVYMATSY
jgi:HK97 family phage major capsid protein